MRYYQQKRGQRLSIGQDGNALTMLIAIQLVVFVILAFIKVIYYFTHGAEGLALYNRDILDWVALPASGNTFLTRPWTLLTHMFVHDAVWHLIANMLWLWAFGYILQDLAGNKKIFPIFFYGALAGAAVFMLSYNLIPALREVSDAKALGASAGVMAIAIGTTVMSPNYRIFPMINGGIPLWIVTLIFTVIDLATIPYNNPGGHLAHLAGAGMGYIFVQQLRRGHDWGGWINAFFEWTNDLFNPSKPSARSQSPKTHLYYKSTVQPYKKTVHLTQQKVDEILEKIHQKGYHSLSEDEKDVLKRASKEDL